MFDYFFVHEDDIPSELGLKMYGIEHITWLIVITILIVLTSIFYAKSNEKNRDRLRKTFAYFLACSEIFKDFVLICLGKFSVEYLPLHLCGVSIFVMLWHAYTKNKVATNVLYSLNMPGALAALLFSNWLNYPLISFFSIHSFLFHAVIVAYVVMQLCTKDMKPDVKYIKQTAIFLLVVAIPIFIFNKIFGTNFFFINYPSPGSPLVLFEKWCGNPGYLVPYVGLLIIVWTLMYLPFIPKKK